MKHYLLTYTKKRQYILFLGDMLVIALSIFFSYVIRVYVNQKYPTMSAVLSRLSPWLILVMLFHWLSLYVCNQYNLNRQINLIRSSLMVILSVWSAGLIISGIFFFLPKYVFGRQVLVIHLLVLSVCLVLWRLLYAGVLVKRSKPKRLAVVGGGQIVSSFIEELSHIRNSGLIVNNLFISNSSSTGISSLPVSLRKHENVLDLLESNDFDVLAFDSTSGFFSDSEIRRILQLKYRGKSVYDLPSLYENITGKVPLTYIDGRWLLSKDRLQGRVSKPYIRVKRLTDIVLSCFGLLLFSPLFVLLSCIVRIEDKGGIFYRQERLGMRRKPFVCYKFRTMVEDAESKSGPIWSRENDPRITRVGRFLRKSHLDELPQLWNILKGDMSFVGPRPIREHFALQMADKVPFYWLRYDVKPGVTGWAQVNGSYAVPDGLESFQYELFYLQNMSLFLDLLTIFKTLRKVLMGEGR